MFYKFLILILFNLKYSNCWFNLNNHQQQQLAQEYAYSSNNGNNNFNNNIDSAFRPVFSYVGCFNDRRESRDISEKDFSYITKFNKSIPTVELCVQLCAQDGYTIAGIQAL